MTTPLLRVAGATKRYRSARALDDLSFTVGAGEWLALLGPNGAGKSTLLGAIAGQVTLDGGRIELNGAPVTQSSVRRRLGFVPQDIALYPALTVTENLRLFASFFGADQGAESVSRALAWAGLSDYSNRAVAELSGGMRRRLNIACGLVHEPDLLLLDEPTVGVDAEAEERVFHRLAELVQAGTTIIQSTHQLAAVEAYCSGALVLQSGVAVASGSVAALRAASATVAHRCQVVTQQQAPALQTRGLWAHNGNVFEAELVNVAEELEHLLGELAARGVAVRDVRIDPPNLESVMRAMMASSE